MGKERLEVLAGGASFVLDDYRNLDVHGLDKEGLKDRTDREGPEGAARELLPCAARRGELGVTAEDGLQSTGAQGRP
jgi:hypothetical protein